MKHIVVIGPPNCGKTALFNCLSKSGQKEGNYAGVTVDVHAATLAIPGAPSGCMIYDAPGIYSLFSKGHEAREVQSLLDELKDKKIYILIVVPEHELERFNPLILELLKTYDHPIAIALNMHDLAERLVLTDLQACEAYFKVPVLLSSAIHGKGLKPLTQFLKTWLGKPYDKRLEKSLFEGTPPALQTRSKELNRQVSWFDRLCLHPVFGFFIFAFIFFNVFQAVFQLSFYPQQWIEKTFQQLGELLPLIIQNPILLSFLSLT